MDTGNIGALVSDLVVGGIPAAMLIVLIIQVAKELGLPSRWLPLSSMICGMALLGLHLYAPANIELLVAGGIALGGAGTMGFRAAKSQLTGGTSAEGETK